MNTTEYLRPVNVDEALRLLENSGEKIRILAGGTDVVIAMRKGLLDPEIILDITCLDELRGIRRDNGYIQIGALTTHSQLRNSKELATWAPMLVDACRDIGSVQIRNLATLGGNLGNASPAGDTIPVLYVLEAEVHLVGQHGDRWVSIDTFFTGPGKTVRRPDELIAGIRFPYYGEKWRGFFSKIGQRRAVRVAKVSASGWLCLDQDMVLECRLALGAVAPTVIRLRDVEKELTGQSLTMERIEKAGQSAGLACSPINDIRSTIEYRRAMASVLVRRGLEKIFHEVKNG